MNISENIKKLQKELPENVKLVAVSKTKSAEMILDAYQSGHKVFGENRIQELVEKQAILPKDIQWHAIGHLQTNKVKHIAPFVSFIHGVDSLKLLKSINKEAQKNQRVIPCLLQLFIAKEESKYGLNLEEAKNILNSHDYKNLKNIRICGVMGMATFTDDDILIQSEFRYLRVCFDELKEIFFKNDKNFKEISMGMSGDYLIAIKEGSTLIRVGSSIFGKRN